MKYIFLFAFIFCLKVNAQSSERLDNDSLMQVFLKKKSEIDSLLNKFVTKVPEKKKFKRALKKRGEAIVKLTEYASKINIPIKEAVIDVSTTQTDTISIIFKSKPEKKKYWFLKRLFSKHKNNNHD